MEQISSPSSPSSTGSYSQRYIDALRRLWTEHNPAPPDLDNSDLFGKFCTVNTLLLDALPVQPGMRLLLISFFGPVEPLAAATAPDWQIMSVGDGPIRAGKAVPAPDHSFDVVAHLNYGYTDPIAVLGEMHRLVKHRGMALALSSGPHPRHPVRFAYESVWRAVGRDDIIQRLASRPPEPGILLARLRAAGFADVAETRRSYTRWRKQTPEEFWSTCSARHNPAFMALAEAEREAVERSVLDGLQGMFNRSRLAEKYAVVMASGRL
jgi:SAM-dependent methyltransferase